VHAVFVNNQHGIQQQGQGFNKKFVFEAAISIFVCVNVVDNIHLMWQ